MALQEVEGKGERKEGGEGKDDLHPMLFLAHAAGYIGPSPTIPINKLADDKQLGIAILSTETMKSLWTYSFYMDTRKKISIIALGR